uniref:Uncharacterized protein n=1 Tax=Anguilla anguilla TaxID=7936 RepID=A0A0E9RPQ9_ANGAN
MCPIVFSAFLRHKHRCVVFVLTVAFSRSHIKQQSSSDTGHLSSETSACCH